MWERGGVLDVVLHPGRDRSLRRRHPWVLSGAVARVEGEAEPGAWARVQSAEGETLGFGHWSPMSQIRLRMLAFGKEPPGDELLVERVARAVARRAADPLLADTDGVRLVNAEGDGLPGLVADRYGDVVVAKLSSAGMALRRELLARALREASGAACALERADAPAARREGIAAREGPLWGAPPESPVPFHERGRRYVADLRHGQKTGFYLDQRDARDLVQRIAAGRRVLDVFAYSGGFAVAAARGGATSVRLVDASAEALRLAERHLAENAPAVPASLHEADGFRFLREERGVYDLLLLDPPPLARRKADVSRAARAHKDALLSALRRAAPDAFLLCFSCSHHVDATLLRQIVFGASLDAGRPLQVLGELGAPSDHPVSLDHPEGVYLKGLWLRA